ncbi:uncharacterized protein LOC115987846 [Quercus lobata]|uniref:uncharacterized protein LOC115987846 n=1 Tax=Quercus lobata TaxID=97700 RepID=UPI001247B3FB|nr:uncharacterized protein LOC115987846 [Quercus lobata]
MSVMGITKVVYYMDPLMSKNLLQKFPDKSSAFDFNYSQSSIWSPLVPRLHSAIDLDFEYFGFVTPKRKSLGSKSKIKIVTSNIKKKLKVAANLVKSKAKHNNYNIKTKASDFSPSPLKPTTKACWTKALKAGSKNFKKTRKDSTAHVKLYTYLMSENI